MKIVQAVECQKCGKLHKTDSDEIITIAGNIVRGDGYEVVGNNLDNAGQVIIKIVFCIDCFLRYLNETLKGTVYRG